MDNESLDLRFFGILSCLSFDGGLPDEGLLTYSFDCWWMGGLTCAQSDTPPLHDIAT